MGQKLEGTTAAEACGSQSYYDSPYTAEQAGYI